MRFGEIPLELDRPPHVIDRARQQRRVRLVARARHLGTARTSRSPSADVRSGVARVERDRALEVGDRAGDERRVERLEPTRPSVNA